MCTITWQLKVLAQILIAFNIFVTNIRVVNNSKWGRISFGLLNHGKLKRKLHETTQSGKEQKW